MAMSLVITVVMFLLPTTTTYHAKASSACSSSCGKLNNISYPFRVHGDPKSCGKSESYEIYCDNSVAKLSLDSAAKYYYVEEINYDNSTIRLVDPLLVDQQNYSYLPILLNTISYPYRMAETNDKIIYLSCNESVNNDRGYVNTTACMDSTDKQYRESGEYLYNYVYIGDLSAKELRLGCTANSVALTSETMVLRERLLSEGNNISCADISASLTYGFLLRWRKDASSWCLSGLAINCGKK
ncbi:hypothetical protein L6164_017711 [Bauhinia variegata]|uniref:Uncharacterized protein n=1 Tax=Bauhinia variegata TaxID=167791 RepID=A0ACB9N8Z1_BAUVA|nr:hypothetical protein L6164_017711 [Bauhinia variegata]